MEKHTAIGPAEARGVGSGEDGQHARGLTRGVALDRNDGRVGVRAAHEGHVGHPRQREVVDVAAAPGEETRVVRPLETGSDVTGGHDLFRMANAARRDLRKGAAW